MKVLVIGSGGREHAIIRKLKENPTIEEIICAPGNGGIAKDAKCINISAIDLANMVELAKNEKVDFCVVTPVENNTVVSKVKSQATGVDAERVKKDDEVVKNLMKKYQIPTAGYAVFSDAQEAINYIRTQNRYPTVLKADGLALGKGVLIAQTEEEAVQAVNEWLIKLLDKLVNKSL